MISLTENEARAVDFLIRNFTEKYNINQLARKLNLSPRGSYKILKKLESQKIIVPEKLGNAIFYSINLENELAVKVSELVLSEKREDPNLETLIEDLAELKKISYSIIVFGSFVENPKKANDVDVLILSNASNYKKLKEEIEEINSILAKEIHPVFQTEKDLEQNIKEKDKVILDIIRTGFILWGSHHIVKAIKKATK